MHRAPTTNSRLQLRPFFETIHRLRTDEEVVLFAKPGSITPDDEQEVADYLEGEWANERLTYPTQAALFDSGAAVWAARMVFTAAQLLLYRDQPATDLPAQLPQYPGGKPTAGAMLSADLCLRFLPAMLHQFSAIDPDDQAIPRLRGFLSAFHYSAVGYLLPNDADDSELDFEMVAASPCLLQLYVDRVIARKAATLAAHPALHNAVRAAMGNHADYLWKELAQ